MIQKLKRIVLDNDTFAGRAFDFGVQLLIVVSLITYSIETLPDLAEGTRKLLFGIECGTVFAFTIEYLLRIYFSQPRLKFMLSFFGLIDLAAILPFYLATGADFRSIRAFRLMRLFRLLKLARYNAAIRRFHRALLIAKEEVILFLCTTIILLWLSAIGIYHFENEAQPEKFKSVFHSLARHRGFAARLRPMDCSS
ncbi:MAG TPA: ion transporter, partial [Planctomycetaceae bacterium]|nr:ion transporter [Planctomycetaceae bacterium]